MFVFLTKVSASRSPQEEIIVLQANIRCGEKKMKKLMSLAILSLSACLSQASYFGIDFSGQLFRIEGNGTGALVGPTGLAQTNSLACLFGVLRTVDQNGDLYRVSQNASTTFDVHLSLGGKTDVRGLTFDNRGIGYCVVDGGGTNQDELWEFATGSGTGTFRGLMGSSTIQGLVINPEDRMFAWDVSATISGGLRTVDRNTGMTTDVDTVNPNTTAIQDLCRNGLVLLGARDSLFNVDKSTGATSLIGSGSYADIRGISETVFSVQPATMSVTLGNITGGNLSSLKHADGNNLRICKGLVPNLIVDPIQITCTTTTAFTSTQIERIFTCFVGKMVNAGSFTLSMDHFNFTTGVFPVGATTPLGLTQKSFAVSPGSPLDYVSGSGEIRSRVRIKANGLVPVPVWCVDIDLIEFSIQRTN